MVLDQLKRTLFWQCVFLGKEGKQGWWNRVCLWLSFYWGLKVLHSWGCGCQCGNWFFIWAGLEKSLVLHYLLCSNASGGSSIAIADMDSQGKINPGSSMVYGSCDICGKVLPDHVIYLPRPFSFQSDICLTRAILAYQSYVTSASIWQLLSIYL